MLERARAFRRIANPVLHTLFRLFYHLDIVGSENVPSRGPFIAMMNHIYALDPVQVAVLAPRFIVIMSKIENYHNPPLRVAMHLYGTFPVHRGELDMAAIRTSLQVLDQGCGLLMAPEGTRSRSWTLQPGLDGVAWLALRSQAPIVPVAHSGQEHLGQCLRHARRARLRMVFGQPFLFLPIEGLDRRQQLALMTREAMYRLAALLPPEYRGVYSDLTQATDLTLVPYTHDGM